MRPVRGTAAHRTEKLGELVCSNTFKSTETSNAHGLLKAEMRMLGSLILSCADEARVPGAPRSPSIARFFRSMCTIASVRTRGLPWSAKR